MNVLIWAEDKPLPEHREKFRELYKNGIEGQLAAFLSENPDMEIRTATMQDAEQGLSEAALDWADVLVYWSHKHWREVEDCHVDYMHKRVLEGMGLVVLHSAHASKIFSRLMGTRTQSLRWRENDERQRYWIVNPAHPVAEGLDGEYFDIPMDETYGEYFEIPQPDEQVFSHLDGAHAGYSIFRRETRRIRYICRKRCRPWSQTPSDGYTGRNCRQTSPNGRAKRRFRDNFQVFAN